MQTRQQWIYEADFFMCDQGERQRHDDADYGKLALYRCSSS